jgi:putative SOS response-associated peptidase YedK
MARMCGRYSQRLSADEIAERFAARVATALPGAQFNVAPTDEVSAVLQPHDERIVDAFRWGLVPAWAEDARGAARLINARAESAPTSPAFRTALARRRCIVPADGFFEFQRSAERVKPQPYFIRRRDGDVMAFAGLWAAWRNPETADRLYTCTILTSVPNELVGRFHHRMPVILEPDAWAHWLDADAPTDELVPMLVPCPSELLDAYPVSRLVNDVRNEGPELLAPVPL